LWSGAEFKTQNLKDMDKDNRSTEVDNTDKKLHISDVSDNKCGWYFIKLYNIDSIGICYIDNNKYILGSLPPKDIHVDEIEEIRDKITNTFHLPIWCK